MQLFVGKALCLPSSRLRSLGRKPHPLIVAGMNSFIRLTPWSEFYPSFQDTLEFDFYNCNQVVTEIPWKETHKNVPCRDYGRRNNPWGGVGWAGRSFCSTLPQISWISQFLYSPNNTELGVLRRIRDPSLQ